MKAETPDITLELRTFVELGERGRKRGHHCFDHLDCRVAAYNYIRMANLVSTHFNDNHGPSHKILDWGCGFGQLSWLLKNRRMQVISYDVAPPPATDCIPFYDQLELVIGKNPPSLPLEDEEFGAVVSCGVLEHVDDLSASLSEIRRVLKPGGSFYLFMFPSKYSWLEGLDVLRGKSEHPLKLTPGELDYLLFKEGFNIESSWQINFLPKSLQGLPIGLKRFYGKFCREIHNLDFFLCKLAPLRLLARFQERIARKK